MRIAVAVLVLAASLATQDPTRDRGRVTQDPARDRGLGRVTDTHGKPWPDAEVHLLHRPHHAIADPAFGEEIVLTTDAKGQFKTGLLVGSAYWAWAIGPLRADGSYRVTRLQHDAVARSPILLREGKRQFVRKLRPELHQSWHGKERLRWRATTEAAGGRVGLSRWLEPDEDGVLTTPRWPDFRVTLQGWTDDWLAYRATFPLTESMALAYGLEFRSRHEKPEAGEVSERLAAVHEFVVPPRRTRELLLHNMEPTGPGGDGLPPGDPVAEGRHRRDQENSTEDRQAAAQARRQGRRQLK